MSVAGLSLKVRTFRTVCSKLCFYSASADTSKGLKVSSETIVILSVPSASLPLDVVKELD